MRKTLETQVIPMVTKVPAWESLMKAHQAGSRIILRAAVPMVVGLALRYLQEHEPTGVSR